MPIWKLYEGERMKQLVILGMVLWLGLLHTVHGKDFNEPRWQSLYSDTTETLKLDVNTVSYDAEWDTADAWVAKININKPRQEVVHYKVYFGSTDVKVVDALLYTPGSNVVVGRRNYDYFMDTEGSEVAKSLLNTVKQLTDRDTKKAVYDKKMKEEYEQAEQEWKNRPLLRINRTVESE